MLKLAKEQQRNQFDISGQLRPAVETSASMQTLHDVPTPPESPKPEPLVPEVYRPLTPPDLSPRPVIEDFMVGVHYKNMPMQYTEIFKVVKNENFQ